VHRSLMLATTLLGLAACTQDDTPLSPSASGLEPSTPGAETPALAQVKGLPANGPIYFGSPIGAYPNYEIFSIQPDGTGLRRLTYDPAVDQMPDVSRDGRKIVFVSKRSGSWEIHSMNSDGSNSKQLTSLKATDQSPPYYPRWSPDGRRIAYYRVLPGETHDRVFVMGASGSSPTAITDGTNYTRNPAWSPDGSKIAFEMVVDGHFQVAVASADGSGAKPVTQCDNDCSEAAWSPDGTIIAARSFPTMQTFSLTGSPEATFPENGERPAFSPDGTKLVYTNAADQTLHVVDVKTKAVTELLDVNWTIVGISWSR
jgi:Tol biopolymer transport system component